MMLSGKYLKSSLALCYFAAILALDMGMGASSKSPLHDVSETEERVCVAPASERVSKNGEVRSGALLLRASVLPDN